MSNVSGNHDEDSVVVIEEEHLSGEFNPTSPIRATEANENNDYESVNTPAATTDGATTTTGGVWVDDTPGKAEEPIPPPPPPPPQQEYSAPPPTQPAPIVIDEEYGLDGGTKPTTTTTTTTRTVDEDKCCGVSCCGCPNGPTQVLVSQVLLLIGVLMCCWSMLDCKFIVATAGVPGTSGVVPNPLDVTRRGFGFFFNETADTGGCPYNQDRQWTEEEFRAYWDFLGSDWQLFLALAMTAICFGCILWFWMFTMCCCSYVKAIRWMIAFMIVFIMVSFQSASFGILQSDFCKNDKSLDNLNPHCEIDRGAYIAIAGICVYFLSALPFLFMTPYNISP